MAYVWSQGAGTMKRDGKLVGRGYAGSDWGKNNPHAEAAPNMGPLPRGNYKMTELRLTGATTGPYTIVLAPNPPDEDLHGRSAFRIHGDSIRAPGTASHGCIILPRAVREAIWNSEDRDLEVVS